jgi:hypothetical protein
MRTFKLTSIDAVDRPAQVSSKLPILKRADGDDAGEFDPVIKRTFTAERRRQLMAEGKAMKPTGAFPIEDREDLKHAVESIGRAKDEAAARKHIVARAKALHAEDELPDDWMDDDDEPSVGKALDAQIRKMMKGTPAPSADSDDPYRPVDWSAVGTDWTARKRYAGEELQKRARKVAKAEGVSTHVAFDRLMKSPAGQALAEACR